jgi:hypothetical protein
VWVTTLGLDSRFGVENEPSTLLHVSSGHVLRLEDGNSTNWMPLDNDGLHKASRSTRPEQDQRVAQRRLWHLDRS